MDAFDLEEVHTYTHLLVIRAVLRNPSKCYVGLPGGPVVKNLPANAGDTGSIPGLGRFHMRWSN